MIHSKCADAVCISLVAMTTPLASAASLWHFIHLIVILWAQIILDQTIQLVHRLCSAGTDPDVAFLMCIMLFVDVVLGITAVLCFLYHFSTAWPGLAELKNSVQWFWAVNNPVWPSSAQFRPILHLIMPTNDVYHMTLQHEQQHETTQRTECVQICNCKPLKTETTHHITSERYTNKNGWQTRNRE